MQSYVVFLSVQHFQTLNFGFYKGCQISIQTSEIFVSYNIISTLHNICDDDGFPSPLFFFDQTQQRLKQFKVKQLIWNGHAKI